MNSQHNVGSRGVLITPFDPLTTIRYKERTMAAMKSTKTTRPDLAGRQFGQLTAVERVGVAVSKGGTRRDVWRCRCACGREKAVQAFRLIGERTKSCGCTLAKRQGVSGVKTHGQSYTRTYRIWRGMIHRCNDPKASAYPKYGAKGIKVCAQWETSFAQFFGDMGHPPTNKHSIDRIRNDLGYEPANCRWATPKEQAANKSKRGGSRD